MKRVIFSTVIAVLALSTASGQTVGVRNICSGKVIQRYEVVSDYLMFTMDFKYNDQSQLISVETTKGSEKIGFSNLDYKGGNYDGFNYDVHLKGDFDKNTESSEEFYEEEGVDTYIKIGANGFAESILEVLRNPWNTETRRYDIEYNADNQISSVKQTGYDEETWDYAYSGDNLVSYTSSDSYGSYSRFYDYSSFSIENKGNIFGVNVGLRGGSSGTVFFAAGVLGLPSRNIPFDDDDEQQCVACELDEDGYVTKMVFSYNYEDCSFTSIVNCTWTDFSDDAKIENEKFTLDENVAVYNLNGQKIYEGRYSDATIPSSQICLIRSNGKTKRVFWNK